jgi:predicted Zn-dependent protease
MLTHEEARAIVETVLGASKADDVEVAISSGRSSNLRFARNSVSTSGSASDTSITVSSTFGKQSGSATVNQTDATTLAEAVRRAEELARLAPADEEYLPPPGPQEYAGRGSRRTASTKLLPRMSSRQDSSRTASTSTCSPTTRDFGRSTAPPA